ASFLSNEDALIKLISEKSIDVVAVIAGQPAKLLADMRPEAKEAIRLLKFDAAHPTSQNALKTYFRANVLATNYPNLLTEDLPSLAVKAMLVTYDYDLKRTRNSLVRFARALCENFPTLQQKGHPKWREVSISQPDLGRGWFYYPPTSRELSTCSAPRAAPTAAPPPPARACPQLERVLGLCDTALAPVK
ncbi:MAG TPA: C4-dicarboxylate ABC transporter substrate-binding protein, partial [Casimicrobiaceae bacterium]|nr:C4-dicarboxylate ABC transporter substrate-binding protein [Casimicrobiaceae bacterium]